MSPPSTELFAQVQLLQATVEALQRHAAILDDKMERMNGWRESAQMVLRELERHDEIGRRMIDGLGALKVELAGTRSDLTGQLNLVDAKVENAHKKIGNSSACREHTQKLSQVQERVTAIPDLWTEVNAVKKQVAAVDKAGGIAHTEWRTVMWSVIGSGGLATTIIWIWIRFLAG